MSEMMPMQPLVRDEHGVIRFRENRLVSLLLDYSARHGLGLNALATIPGITAAEHMQLAQLIGYSVSGFGDLSYADPEVVATADELAGQLLDRNPA